MEASQPEEKRELAKIKESVRTLLERRSESQKDLGRLEAQIEMARSQPAAVAVQKNGRSADNDDEVDKLTDLIKKLKTELELALNEDPRELQAVVETIIEEMQFAIEDAARRGKRMSRASERNDSGRESGEAMAKKTGVPEGIKKEFEKLTADLRALEKELIDLRAQEKSLEESQEGFYKVFKEAIAAVQTAKNKIGEWESASRARVLEKERLDLRREEIVRQIEQAGRHAEDFAKTGGTVSDAHGASAPASFSSTELQDMEKRLFRLRGELASIGEVDQALMKEAQDTETRYAFLTKESEDLEKAVADLTALMHELSEKIKTEFDKSLHKINDAFNEFFKTMFGEGAAKLKVQKPKEIGGRADDEDGSGAEGDGVITDLKDDEPEDPLLPQKAGGVEIELKLARKRITSLDALSGGERSLVGIAALFAMVSVSPPPFLVLDEIDAPLDERNARRFSEMLKNFSKHTQFLVVTHNRATMEAADILYGVTLAEDGSSKVVSLKLEN